MIGQERGDLGALIRARVLAGALPNDMPRKVWAGYGSGKACSACDQIIVKALDVEYDVEMDDGRGFLFHQSCLALWHQERATYFADTPS